MGGSHSRQDPNSSDSEDSSEEEEQQPHNSSSPKNIFKTPEESSSSLHTNLKDLKLKHPSSQKNSIKLYFHIGGNSPTAKWITSENLTSFSFTKSPQTHNNDDDWWYLKIGSKVQVKVGTEMQLKMSGEQCRVDFVSNGVWAMKFFNQEDYRNFISKFQECLFENTYGIVASDENKVKIFGKDFIGWVNPKVADDSVWEDSDNVFDKSPVKVRATQNLMEDFEEAYGGKGIQSLALGALENSFLVGDSGVQVVRNYSHGIQGKGVYVKYGNGCGTGRSRLGQSVLAPKKVLLMRAETNMLLMNSGNDVDRDPRSTGIHQFDIETGRIVSEWKFEKDGIDITMRDITNDSKGAQLDASESTFLGLDDNRLCRWDMRDRKGMVQDLATASAPVLQWTQGHQFSRGTNFQCFATAGDGSIVVGSLDGKIRLYSKTSMRQAKTAFPGLGVPITHVDVTYDGKWTLGTTDSFLVLVCTMFTDKDGNTKNGFNGRMGNKISAPRLLKLTPLDSHLAGANTKFHGGQFSWVMENGRQERHLVATVGNFSVIWNFQQVKNSVHECYQNQEGLKSCYCYKIVLKEDSIVDSRFMHDKFDDSLEAPLVVATPMMYSSFSISTSEY